jgi:hypothetical protein
VAALDFDILAGGHGALFAKDDVTATRIYFEDLTAAVAAGMAQGKSMQELMAELELPQYRDWANYERLRANNIEAAFLNLELYR